MKEFINSLWGKKAGKAAIGSLAALFIIGGGGCLLKNFSDLTAKSEVTVITDICANAKGYEALAMMKQRMRG